MSHGYNTAFRGLDWCRCSNEGLLIWLSRRGLKAWCFVGLDIVMQIYYDIRVVKTLL